MKPKRTRDAAASREAILEAAEKVFAEHGFHAARVEEIARAAGVAKGTVFLHFGDKENLLFALVEHRATTFQELYASLAKSDRAPRARLETLLEVHKWMRNDLLDFRRTMMSMWTTLPAGLRKRLQEFVRRTHTLLRDRVADLYREFLGPDGVAGSGPEELAAALLACVDGLTIRLRIPAPVPSTEAVVRAAKLVFIDNLERRARQARQNGERKPKP
jgi:TetR/AcrR family fatty acid metabolism transcriptional regulator